MARTTRPPQTPDPQRELADYVAASRKRQGLPPRIQDPTAIARIAVLIAPTARPAARRGRRRGARST